MFQRRKVNLIIFVPQDLVYHSWSNRQLILYKHLPSSNHHDAQFNLSRFQSLLSFRCQLSSLDDDGIRRIGSWATANKSSWRRTATAATAKRYLRFEGRRGEQDLQWRIGHDILSSRSSMQMYNIVWSKFNRNMYRCLSLEMQNGASSSNNTNSRVEI